jgi:predicted nucleic acid-binding protein
MMTSHDQVGFPESAEAAVIAIAATAVVNDLTLLTHNRRHFERVPGLELYQDS